MVNKKYILLDKEKNDAEEDFFSAAFSFPLDDILKYLLGIDKDDDIVERVESFQSSNPIFKDRVEGTKIFIENNNIKTIEAYHSLEEKQSEEFIETAMLLLNPKDSNRDDLLNSILKNPSPITGFGSLLKTELISFKKKASFNDKDGLNNTMLRQFLYGGYSEDYSDDYSDDYLNSSIDKSLKEDLTNALNKLKQINSKKF